MAYTNTVGIDHKLYRNTGSFGTAVWNLVDNVRDLTIADSFAEADVSRRASGIKQMEPTIRDISIDFEMVWDTADVDFAAMFTAYAARSLLEFAFADGPIGTAGTVASGGTVDVTFTRLSCKIFKWERNEPLEGAATVSVTLKHCYTANASTSNVVA